MLKQLYEMAQKLLGLSRDVTQHEAQIKELQSQMRAVTAALQDLTFEVRRMRENEEHEREKMALRLENALLRSGRILASGTSTADSGSGVAPVDT